MLEGLEAWDVKLVSSTVNKADPLTRVFKAYKKRAPVETPVGAVAAAVGVPANNEDRLVNRVQCIAHG